MGACAEGGGGSQKAPQQVVLGRGRVERVARGKNKSPSRWVWGGGGYRACWAEGRIPPAGDDGEGAGTEGAGGPQQAPQHVKMVRERVERAAGGRKTPTRREHLEGAGAEGGGGLQTGPQKVSIAKGRVKGWQGATKRPPAGLREGAVQESARGQVKLLQQVMIACGQVERVARGREKPPSM